jgi:hypothetical protein
MTGTGYELLELYRNMFDGKNKLYFHFKKILLSPDDSYYDNYRKYLRSKDPEMSSFDNGAFYNSQANLGSNDSKVASVTSF